MLKRFCSRLTLRQLGGLVILLAAGVLATAYIFQYQLDLKPCVLCLYQRLPYVALIAVGLGLLALPKFYKFWLGLGGLIGLASLGLAAFHTGVERGWWEMTEACDSDLPTDSLEALQAALMSADLARCDEIAWQLFGLSMANYNVLLSLALTIIFVWRFSYEHRTRV